MLRPCQTDRKPKPQALRRAGGSTGCRRSRSSWSAPSSTIWGRRWRCCCSPGSTCSGWPGCGSPARRSCSRSGGGPGGCIGRLSTGERWNLLALGLVLAVMNSAFYLAVDRLPLSTVGAIEFLGTVILAAAGARTRRNAGALVLTTAGVVTITSIRITGQPLGFVFAFANCALFMLYIVLGHRMANAGGRGPPAGRPANIDRLAGAMVDRGGHRDAVGAGRGAARVPAPGLAAGRGRGGRVLLGDPLRDRSAGHGPVAPRDVLADAGPAAGLRHRHRRDRAAPDPDRPGRGGHRPGRARRRTRSGNINQERKQRGLRTAGIGRAEGIPDLPGHDELRQPGRTRLAP